MKVGLCQRLKRCLRPLVTAMFKRQKLDSSSTNMIDEADKSIGKTRKSKSPTGKRKINDKTAGNMDVEFLSSPIKSLSDTKEYQVIKLKNGLIATLVSDTRHLIDLKDIGEDRNGCASPSGTGSDERSSSGGESDSDTEIEEGDQECKRSQEKLAACALTVEVGSFSDPEDIQGLSHFLEHMVFMGSEKYQKENEFDSFIKRYGGSDNAFTECEFTTYHFEIHEKHLFKAMDIFSQFFIKPLLKWDAINREREAIESEFQQAMPQDAYRKDQLLCSFATPENPARKFTWGNQYTLRDNVSDEYLHEAVSEYRKKHYSADRMKLAVQGRLPLDVLREWVVTCFSNVLEVPNQADVFQPLEEPFDMNKFCKFYYVSTVKDLTAVEIRWALPPVFRRYKTKPLHYLQFIIGHEGKGSLLSYLKKKLWALGLQAGYGDDGLDTNDLYTIFSISITLTDEGRTSIKDVLTATFSYMKMLRENAPSERLYKEVKSLAEIGFRFQEESSATDHVETISQNMVVYPPEDYLRGDALYFEYDPEEIKLFLSKMVPSNSNIMLFSKDHDVQLDQEEFWFKTKYRAEEIPEKWIEEWNSVRADPEFQLPEENKFITNDFAMVSHENVPKYPQKIKDTDLVEIWYKADDKFLLPIASIDILIVSPSLSQSADKSVYGDLFIKLLHHQLMEELYHAVAADLEYSLTVRERGVQVGVYGYNQHLDLLLDRIAQGIREFNEQVEEDVLDAFKKLFVRNYYNDILKVGNVAQEIRKRAYLSLYHSSSQKYKHVKSVNLTKLREFISEFFHKVHFQALVQGNITSANGEQIVDKFIRTLHYGTPLEQCYFPSYGVKIIPKGEKCCRVSSFNVEDKNCVTTVYFQYGPGTINDYVALELFVMIMEEPLFDTLRTQQQLGYDVSTSVREAFGILGFSVTVHSQINKFTVDHVKERIDEFVNGFVNCFSEIPDEDFKDSQESLINLKSCVDTSLKQETKRHFEEIKSQEFVFDRLEKEICFIHRLKKQTVSEMMCRFVSPDGPEKRKFVVQVVGHDSTKSNIIPNDAMDEQPYDSSKHTLPDEIVYDFLSSTDFPDGYFVSNLDEWKSSMPEFPPHKLNK